MTKIQPPAANWNFPTRVWFGIGRASEIAQAISKIGSHNPLLVTDQGLAKNPMIAEMRKQLSAASIKQGVFTRIKPNPTGQNIEAGVAAFSNGLYLL